MNKKLLVKFVPQSDSSVPEDWRERSCAIVCLKMCLDFYGKNNSVDMPSASDLLTEALAMSGGLYNPQNGWKHDALVWLAHNHGVPAYKEEFRSDTINIETGETTPSIWSDALRDEGLKRIKKSLDNNVPVIVSFLPGFGSVSDSHMVVVVGHSDNGFLIHDPSNISPKEGVEISGEEFLKYWRKYAIFIG